MAPIERIVRRRRLVLGLYVAAASVFLPGVLLLEIDNSPERFFVQDAEALERFRDLELTFGRDRAVRLVVPGEEVWTREGLARLGALEEAAQDRERVGGGVFGTAGLHRQHRWHLDEWPPADPEAFRELVTSDPLDRNLGWVSRDGRFVSILAGLFEMPRERREATLERLEALLPEGGFAVGIAVVNRALDRAARETFRGPLLLLLSVAVALLLGVFRGRRALLPLALAGVSETVVLGAMGYAGGRLDLVTMILAPLLFVVAVATGVHVLAYHRRLPSAPTAPEEAVAATYRVKTWPVFWAGATTCVGFGSLAVSSVPPVRWLGLWAAFGIAYLTLAALSFYPALLAAASGPRTGEAGSTLPRLGRLGETLAGLAVRRRRAVFLAFGAVAVVATAGVPHLVVETDPLTYLRPEHPVRAQIAALEASGVGSVSASLVVVHPDERPLDPAEGGRKLAEVAAALRREPQVLGAVAPGDLLAGVVRHDPKIDAASADALEAARRRVELTPELAPFLSLVEADGGERSRVLLSTGMRTHRELTPLYRRAESLAARAFPEAEVWVTGQYPLVLAAQRSLLRTMVLSFSLTVGVIAAILWALLRSLGLAWRILAANLWPVLLVLGAMGWLGVPVDGATVMIASVVLALAVDDTLHAAAHFRRILAARGGDRVEVEGAAVATLRETAPGHVTTSAVLVLGLAMCALSPLVPVARFGALAATGIAGALAADLLLVPALLASAPAAPRPAAGEERRTEGAQPV